MSLYGYFIRARELEQFPIFELSQEKLRWIQFVSSLFHSYVPSQYMLNVWCFESWISGNTQCHNHFLNVYHVTWKQMLTHTRNVQIHPMQHQCKHSCMNDSYGLTLNGLFFRKWLWLVSPYKPISNGKLWYPNTCGWQH